MSNEEWNDEMPEEEDPSDVESSEDAPEPEEPESAPEAAGEPEIDDETYGAAAPSDGGASSAGIWVIIVLVIVALIGLGYYQINRAAMERAREEAQERQQIREAQVAAAIRGVPEAESALERGDVDLMILELQQMDEKLQIIATAANQAGDADAARDINAMRSAVSEAIKELEPEYEEIQRRREQLLETAATRLQDIRARLADVDPAAPADPADVDPVDEPVVEEDPEPVEEPVVDDDEPAEVDEPEDEEEPAEEPTPETDEAD